MNSSAIFNDAEQKIAALVNALKMHDADTLSEKPVKEALGAIQRIVSLLQGLEPAGEEWVLQKRRVAGLIDPLKNTALLIALGAMRKPFEETLDGVQKAIQKVDLNKVKRTQFEPRGQS